MKNPLIITIGRQCGSGGHEIGKRLADRLELPFYDKTKLMDLAKHTDHYDELKSFYEEHPVNSLLFAIAINQTMKSPSDKPFSAIRNLIGTSGGVLVGRCGNVIFRNYKNCVSIFIHADIEKRLIRISETRNINTKNAQHHITDTDKERREFHQYFTK